MSETAAPGQCATATQLYLRITIAINIVDLFFENRESKERLIFLLKRKQQSIYYTAPEIVPNRWHEVCDILDASLGRPGSPDWSNWKEAIRLIMEEKLPK